MTKIQTHRQCQTKNFSILYYIEFDNLSKGERASSLFQIGFSPWYGGKDPYDPLPARGRSRRGWVHCTRWGTCPCKTAPLQGEERERKL